MIPKLWDSSGLCGPFFYARYSFTHLTPVTGPRSQWSA